MPPRDRGFKEVIVEPTGFQRGRDRPDYYDDPLLLFRNNLTALSQTCNLYFVACADVVRIHQPVYPRQTLNAPVMVLETEKSLLAGPGHVNPTKPHGINHLLRGELGFEEIIVCACDDGDVYAYYVRSIFNALKSYRGAPKPFFHENVGASAWGLDIHKEARLIAVSSNTHIIDVFAPALLEQALDPGQGSSTPHLVGPWRTTDYFNPEPLMPPFHENVLIMDRSVTRQMKLKAHSSNIPSISFSAGDKAGQWLVSTDIDGVVLIWDLHHNEVVEDSDDLYDNECFFDDVDEYTMETIPALRDQLSGWGVLCLDPLEFIPTVTHLETWGGNLTPDRRFFDITPSIDDVKNNALVIFSPVLDDSDSEDAASNADNANADNNFSSFSLGPPVSITTGSVTAVSSTDDRQSTHQEGTSADQGSTSASEVTTRDMGSEVTEPVAAEPIGPIIGIGMVWDAPPELRIERAKISRDPFVIFHSSALSMRLFINPLDELDIACQIRKPLSQRLYGGFETHFSQENRLNLVTHVPELGVVIVGSGHGRVGIFSLTKNQVTQDMAFRLDHVLPFERQEEKRQRPIALLVGVAIAPLQGYQFVSDENRSQGIDVNESWRAYSHTGREYRLMLTYHDGTVLSYRVARDLLPRNAPAPAPGFEPLS